MQGWDKRDDGVVTNGNASWNHRNDAGARVFHLGNSAQK